MTLRCTSTTWTFNVTWSWPRMTSELMIWPATTTGVPANEMLEPPPLDEAPPLAPTAV